MRSQDRLRYVLQESVSLISAATCESVKSPCFYHARLYSFNVFERLKCLWAYIVTTNWGLRPAVPVQTMSPCDTFNWGSKSALKSPVGLHTTLDKFKLVVLVTKYETCHCKKKLKEKIVVNTKHTNLIAYAETLDRKIYEAFCFFDLALIYLVLNCEYNVNRREWYGQAS